MTRSKKGIALAVVCAGFMTAGCSGERLLGAVGVPLYGGDGADKPGAGGTSGGGTITRVEGVDGCMSFAITADNDLASYGSDISFSLIATNTCPEPYTISATSRPPAGFCITTSGTTCDMVSSAGQMGNRYVATLPRDGRSPWPFEQVLLQNETYSATMPWDPEGEGMANRSSAPEGLYDVYAFLGGLDAVPFNMRLTIEVRN